MHPPTAASLPQPRRPSRCRTALYGFRQTQFICLQNAIQRVGPLLALWLPSALTGTLATVGFGVVGLLTIGLGWALARGVLAARGSSLLLLDEPGSALDALIEQTVPERLSTAFHGACIVSAVHRLSLLRHFERVVDVGSADELKLGQPLFAALRRGAGSELDQREPGQRDVA